MKTLTLPSSKSLLLRYMILSACARTGSILHRVNLCDDTRTMLECLKMLWSVIDYDVHTMTMTISPLSYEMWNQTINLNDSWASMRFLSALAMINTSWTITLQGSTRLSQRPMSDQIDGMKQLWAIVYDTVWCLPIDVVWWSILKHSVTISGATSSQYCSAFILVAAQTLHGLHISIIDDLVSKPYIDMTLDVLNQYGIGYIQDGYTSFQIEPQSYDGVDMTVEWDASSLTYRVAYVLLNGWSIHIENIWNQCSQWDYAFVSLCTNLWLSYQSYETSTTLCALWLQWWYLSPTTSSSQKIDFSDMPDASITYMILALFIPWDTTITWLQTLAHKESHRIQVMVTELSKLWVTISCTIDSMTIGTLNLIYYAHNKDKIMIETYNDHRIAMAFGILNTILCNLTILNPNCVNKTYPLFWEDLRTIQA